MKRRIGVVLALCLMGLAIPGTVLAAEDKGGQAAEQVQAAEAMLRALLDQGVPVEKAVKKVLEKYPEAAPPLIADVVQIVLAQGEDADKAVEKVVEVVREVLGEEAKQVVAQGLLLAGVDPEPYLEVIAAGNKDAGRDNDNANEDNTDTVTGVELPDGGTTGAGGGGGAVSPS